MATSTVKPVWIVFSAPILSAIRSHQVSQGRLKVRVTPTPESPPGEETEKLLWGAASQPAGREDSPYLPQ